MLLKNLGENHELASLLYTLFPFCPFFMHCVAKPSRSWRSIPSKWGFAQKLLNEFRISELVCKCESSQGPVIPNVVDVFVESRGQGCGSAAGSTSIGAGLMPLREAVSSACFRRALSAAS